MLFCNSLQIALQVSADVAAVRGCRLYVQLNLNIISFDCDLCSGKLSLCTVLNHGRYMKHFMYSSVSCHS